MKRKGCRRAVPPTLVVMDPRLRGDDSGGDVSGFPSAGLRPDPPLCSGRSGPQDRQNDTQSVMAGPVPAISIGPSSRLSPRDHRHKAGDDAQGGIGRVTPPATEGCISLEPAVAIGAQKHYL